MKPIPHITGIIVLDAMGKGQELQIEKSRSTIIKFIQLSHPA